MFSQFPNNKINNINNKNKMEEISIFKCNFCFREWDEFESQRQYRLRKCCVCHDEICKTCFYNKDNKQKCFSCQLGNTPRSKNKCIQNS